jgi:hypothetical protein
MPEEQHTDHQGVLGDTTHSDHAVAGAEAVHSAHGGHHHDGHLAFSGFDSWILGLGGLAAFAVGLLWRRRIALGR